MSLRCVRSPEAPKITRQEASGTRSCSRPSRKGFASTTGAVNVMLVASVLRFYRNAECRMQNAKCRMAVLLILHSAFIRCYPRPVMWQYTPRVAVIKGLRTPFAKSGTHYAQLSALDLGKMVVSELMQRSGIDPKSVQEVVFGNVIPSVKAPNIAREIVLGTGLPRSIPG